MALLRARRRTGRRVLARLGTASFTPTAARRPAGRRRGGRRLPLARSAIASARSSSHCGAWPASRSGRYALRAVEVERTGSLVRLEHDDPLVAARRARSALGGIIAPRSSRPARQAFPRPMLVRIAQRRAGTRCTRSRSPGCSTGTASASRRRCAPRPRGACKRWSETRAFGRSPPPAAAALLRAAALAQSGPAASSTATRSRRPRRRVSSGSAPTADRVRPSPLRVGRLLVRAARSSARTHRALADVGRPTPRNGHGTSRSAARAPDAGGAGRVGAAARGARMRGAPDTAAELTELALAPIAGGCRRTRRAAPRVGRTPLPGE